MLKRNALIILLLLAVAGTIGWTIYSRPQRPRYGYVVIADLYNGFDMKKEMEKKYLEVKNAREKILDSLEVELKMIGSRIRQENGKDKARIASFEGKRNDYLELKKTYGEDDAALSKKYDQQILAQLNQYVKNYGEQNKYSYIFGNDGNGSLMYAADAENITKEVTAYINLKYKGE